MKGLASGMCFRNKFLVPWWEVNWSGARRKRRRPIRRLAGNSVRMRTRRLKIRL